MTNRLDKQGTTAAAYALLFASLAVTASPVYGQEADSDDEIFELSPFTVNAAEDEGYRAMSTLAGTRIKTELKDLGASISVVTDQFMEDTGATGLDDLFQYTTGTEIGGMNGNYSAADLSAGGGRVDQDETRREPQAGGRIRGLARPNYTRNYFSTSIPVDRYNTSSITISRGPNSLLFGLGSAGGVVDASLGLAGIGNNDKKVQVRFDEYGSQRYTFDFNQTLIDDRLAVKVSAVKDDQKYEQEEAFRDIQRLYGAMTAVLYKGSNEGILGQSSLRANFEIGEEDLTPPDALPPNLAWDSFFERPFDFRPYSGIDYRQGFDTLNDGWEKWGTLDTRRTIDPVTGEITPGYDELTTPLHSTSHIFTQLGLVFGDAGNGTSSGPTVVDGSTGIVGFQGWIPGFGGLPFTNPFVNTRSYYETDGSAAFKASNLTNKNIFDYEKHLITGDAQKIRKSFDSEMVSFEQLLFGGDGGIELTAGQEYYRLERYQPFGGSGRNLPIYVDTSEYLNDSLPNPNVGRAFMLMNGDTDEWRTIERENLRATAFYTLDMEGRYDNWLKWFGRHTFTGLFQEEDRVNKNVQYGRYWTGVGDTDFARDVWGQPNNSNQLSFAGQLVQFAYISDDLRGVEYDDVRLNMLSVPQVNDGEIYEMQYFDHQDRVYKTGQFQINRFAQRGSNNVGRTNVSSEAFAWQSYLFNSNIVGLAGWRSDTIDTYGAANFRPSLPNNALDVENALEVAEAPNSTQTGDTFTWSVVGHTPRNIVEKIPGVSSLSVHYGESENFSAIKQRNDIYNNAIGNPAGLTEEMGISLGFAEDKWLLRLTRFETNQALADVGTDVSFQAINEITRALNNYTQAELTGLDFEATQAFTQGIASYQDLYDRVLGTLPAETQAIYNYYYDPEISEWDNDGQIEGISATTDRVAEGYELELVGNPARGWRVMMNVAQVETINSNTAEQTFQYASDHLAALEAAGLTNVNDSPAGIVTMGSRYRNEVYSVLVSQRAKDGTVSQEQREWRANLINTYNFREGFLKGVGIGGALRWQSSIATGYETFIDEFGNQVPDVNSPFKGDDELNGDLWVSYAKQLSDNLDWKIQLNIRNLIGDDDLIPVFTNPDGTDAIFRVAPDQTWFLTNTFSF